VEQLNIVGKRSGDGFVAHKAVLVGALSRALADRVMLMDLTIGRKGFLGYLKALGGSNVVKVIPSNGSASGSQANGHKRLKVICGANTSYLADSEWIGDKTPMSLCEVRVSPNNSVKPNIGSLELSEALSRVLPFTAKDDDRPVLACVLFIAKDGKLTLVSADGFRLAVTSLDYEDGEGQALINRDELQGIANALRRAKRARVSFDGDDIKTLTIDTELIRYKWASLEGNFPDWEKLIPTEFNTLAHFDTVEAIKAVSSLKAISNSKAYPIDLTAGDGKLVMANPDDKGQAELPADTDGEVVKIRVDGKYLAEALKACGGMAELKLTNGVSPILFTVDGYQLVVMPMLTPEAQAEAKAKAKAEQAKAEATTKPAESQPEANQPVTEKPKAKPKRAKQPVSAK
jgi:DNA polymerase-3 subunit beta